MAEVNIHLLVCCLFVASSWGYKVKRDTYQARQNVTYGGPQLPTNPISYGIVCDAGSTSTRLKIYRINRTEESLGYPQIDLIYNKEFDPSLDKFVDDENGLRDYVTRILNQAKKIVPASQLSETHAYFLGTAGLRFLSVEDSKQLLQGTIAVFDSFQIQHFHGHEGISILSGEEEGAYVWIAANYLLGNFANNRPDNETVGVLEMGGGSTQISFIPSNPIYDGEFQITIKGRRYDLYVHSYLQFGINAVAEWIATVLTQLYPNNLVLENPCMLKGDSEEVQLEDGQTLLLRGTSDPEGCQQILTQILEPETGIKCEPKHCAIGSVYQPSVGNNRFYAIQGFTYAPIAFNALGPDKVLNIDLLEQRGFNHCKKNLTEAAEEDMNEKFAASNCLMGVYTPTLFTLSYGFPRNTTNIRVTNTVEGNTIEWSLGVMVMDVYQNTITRRRR